MWCLMPDCSSCSCGFASQHTVLCESLEFEAEEGAIGIQKDTQRLVRE
jgi:hypothetical protein